MRFNFTGKIEINSESAKVPGFREINGKANGISMNLIAVAAQNNRAFMECAGFKNDTIKTFDTENNKIEIDWNDRKDPDVIKKVANYRKNIITLNDERYEFISTLDFIKFIRDNIDEIKGKCFTVTGTVQKNEYKGKISDRFVIQNIFELKDDKKFGLGVHGEFFFSADGVDTADWKKEKKIIFNGYTQEYINKDHPRVYVDKSIVFDCSKLDLDDEKHVALLNYKLKQMGLSYENGNINVNLKKNTYYKQAVVLEYINGAEEIEFDEKLLTDVQKEAIALGLKTPEDFRPVGKTFGDRVQIFKLKDFDLRGAFENGIVKLEDKASEFEENIYATADDETEDVLNGKMNPPESGNDSAMF